MSYKLIIRHIQNILNQCGDPVNLTPTGLQTMSEPGQMSIEIKRTLIMRQNKCCAIQPPVPVCRDNPEDRYWINRIRISQRLADAYTKNPLTDEQMKDIICEKPKLFGCY
ncbi:hypothetical protein ACLB9Y_00935 [Chryseobacterium scophthalmum]|uniref:hypothetical protein n=1 Tax=Chryseobacterium scophthalmum TaxID=59733 RepID=UPI00398B6877